MAGIVYRQCHIHRNEHGQCLLRADSFTCSRDLGVLDKSTGFFPNHKCTACDNTFKTKKMHKPYNEKKEYSILQVIVLQLMSLM